MQIGNKVIGKGRTYKEIPLGVSGVYEFFDDFNGEVLKIGKAQDLRKRLYQYQQLGYGHAYNDWIKMESYAGSLKFRIYPTDEPARLEASMIRSKKPKFNIRVNE